MQICETVDAASKTEIYSSEMPCRQLRRIIKIYELGFAMTEALLYLDTHPDDAEAIEYYNSIKPQYSEAVADYEECFGAIIATGTNGCGYWNWQATPLPWEKEGC